ncbi:MAG: septation regulator SpoVG [Spirochaetaceae bacterium]|nr:MAG: septation regulator SpoVG [Spirochaetaceae bacterium]
MEITDIRIKKVSTGGKLKAYVTVTFDDCFVVHNLKIISGKAGTFIAMPSRKTKTGEYKDIAHPINSEFRHRIQNEIIGEYDKVQDEIESVEEDDSFDSDGVESDHQQE